jgi:hypothetical protein
MILQKFYRRGFLKRLFHKNASYARPLKSYDFRKRAMKNILTNRVEKPLCKDKVFTQILIEKMAPFILFFRRLIEGLSGYMKNNTKSTQNLSS